MTRRQKKAAWRIAAAAVLLAAAWPLPLHGPARLAAFLIPYAVVGWDVLKNAGRNIVHGRVFDEKLLMAIATIGAFATGEYPEAVAVMLFYQVGELFQSIAVGRSRKSIAELMELRPDYANVLRDGQELRVDPDEVSIGERIVVRPGERVPLDGTIVEGATAVDASALTGESMPLDKNVGDALVSGSVNLTGAVTVQVERVFSESTAAKILELVESASEKKARAERFITRFARWYTPAVVIAAVLLCVVPPLFPGQTWRVWFSRALIFLVVSCPCALVISIPLSFFGGIGGASRRGILMKGAGDLETLAGVRTVVFDKTGTLTTGRFAVTGRFPAGGVTETELLEAAAAAERFSNHPIAAAVLQACQSGIDPARLKHARAHTGHGVEVCFDGRRIFAGNAGLMMQIGVTPAECTEPGTVLHIASDGRYLGCIVVSDTCKAEAVEAIAALNRLGVKKTVMLTGDRRNAAEAVAQRLGLTEFRAELLPADKVDAVESLLREGQPLAFVGDGVNDAPVLARADVGVAMGALGSDAAIEAADVVLMDDSLLKLPEAIMLARRTMRIVRQNILFALAVKALVLLLGALGMASMWTAVFADVGVMVLAILNAMRALRAPKR